MDALSDEALSSLSVHPDEIKDQREKGWPDFHPETFCHRCGQRNVWSWFADSDEWNKVDPTHLSILCPQCFTEGWAKVTGMKVSWHLVLAESGDLRRAGWQSPEAIDALTAKAEAAMAMACYAEHKTGCATVQYRLCSCGLANARNLWDAATEAGG
jgi:hypothetical protein